MQRSEVPACIREVMGTGVDLRSFRVTWTPTGSIATRGIHDGDTEQSCILWCYVVWSSGVTYFPSDDLHSAAASWSEAGMPWKQQVQSRRCSPGDGGARSWRAASRRASIASIFPIAPIAPICLRLCAYEQSASHDREPGVHSRRSFCKPRLHSRARSLPQRTIMQD